MYLSSLWSGAWKIRVFVMFMRKIITLLKLSKHVAKRKDLSKMKSLLIETDVIESWKRGRVKSKWKVWKLLSFLFFAALLMESKLCVSTLCCPIKKAFRQLSNNWREYPKTIQRYHTTKTTQYLISAVRLHFRGNEKLEEENSKLFKIFPKKTCETDSANVPGVCLEDFETVETLFTQRLSCTPFTL